MESMTGFGTSDGKVRGLNVTASIKSVNGKFLDVSVRLPSENNPLEWQITKYMEKNFSRGTFTVSIRAGEAARASKSEIDPAAARKWIKNLSHLRKMAGIGGELGLGDLLAVGREFIIERNGTEKPLRWEEVKPIISRAAAKLRGMRRKEGKALSAEILRRLGYVEHMAEEIGSMAGMCTAEFREKLRKRIEREIEKGKLDSSRLEQEVVIYADRSDVTEECARIATHAAHFREMASETGPVGRRIDFLIQELNRETNTMGSKSSSPEISSRVVSMKAEMEKIREQIQNIE